MAKEYGTKQWRPNLRNCPGIFRNELRKNKENFSLFPDRYLNPVTLEYGTASVV
jgi:hypothetical protein